jgi:hypothetical protein
MSISLQDLQAAATGSKSSAAVSFHSMTVEDARGSVVIKDGNRKPAQDGSQALTVTLGKHTLPLDCIKLGTTRLSVTEAQVEGYSEALQSVVDEGGFDTAIEAAQVLAKAQFERTVATNAAKKAAGVAAPEATEGLDLDSLGESEE